MCGEIEISRCDICGADNVPINRKYYHYPNIKCECHSPHHFDIVRYCNKCKPHPPKETKVILKTETIKALNDIIEAQKL